MLQMGAEEVVAGANPDHTNDAAAASKHTRYRTHAAYRSITFLVTQMKVNIYSKLFKIIKTDFL